MSLDHESILEKKFEKMKELIEEHEPELEALIAKEKEKENRQEVIKWLETKKKRKDLLNDEDAVKELLSHIEHAYRTASISEETYSNAKFLNKKLLEKN